MDSNEDNYRLYIEDEDFEKKLGILGEILLKKIAVYMCFLLSFIGSKIVNGTFLYNS